MSSYYGRQAAQSRLNNHHVQTNPASPYYVWVIPRAKSPSNQPEREVCHLFFFSPPPIPRHTHTHSREVCLFSLRSALQSLSTIILYQEAEEADLCCSGLVVIGALTFLCWSDPVCVSLMMAQKSHVGRCFTLWGCFGRMQGWENCDWFFSFQSPSLLFQYAIVVCTKKTLQCFFFT